MCGEYEDYANVVDFGARPNSFLDDTEAFLKAFDTENSVYVPAGIYYVNQTLKIENQNLVGGGCFATQIVSCNSDKNMPIIMAGRSCCIKDIMLRFNDGIITGEEKEGERVGILTHSDTFPLQRASSITRVRIENVGTAIYMPRNYIGCGPFCVDHSNLELQHFSFRGIDYGAHHRIGNSFSNIFMLSNYEVDCMIHLEGDAANVSMSQITIINSRCRRSAITFSNVYGFNISTLHISNIGITRPGHALLEFNNASGEIGALHCNYIPIECDDVSLIRLYNANHDICIFDGKMLESERYIRIGDITVCGLNDPTRDLFPDSDNTGLVAPYDDMFRFVSRKEGCTGKYFAEIGGYSYFTFKNDRETYEEFRCDDDRIEFLKKGTLIPGGPTKDRPKHRLCRYVTEYFDTDIGKKLCWDGEKWV